MPGQVSGVTEWHIDALEPDLPSHSSAFKNSNVYNAEPSPRRIMTR
ncbi:hypothetical protein SAMCFNEI73_Ch0618 [Sinorhizobium americanum]|uniref:Uncharacterized protein n=1 Tax=Sinorhizobium americanum TaxID=194963 RepID=A0A1L3LIK5_9HYPH|nr:hypothetical protein SAMCFNEI73_Ch0618 [Sinorhizobium americanum]